MKIVDNVKLGLDVSISDFVNVYGCSIGDNTRVGPFTEIQKGVKIGNKCKIQSHSFICEGVTIGNGVFVGHGVIFINDRYPRTLNQYGEMQDEKDWEVIETVIEDGVSLGSGSIIMCGVTIGQNAIIGAGTIVTKDIPPGKKAYGNPLIVKDL